MGLSVARTPLKFDDDVWGSHRVAWRDVTFDSSYASGGEVLSPASFGLKTIQDVEIVGYDTDAAPYVIKWDKDNGKLMAFVSAGFTPAGTVAAPTFTGSALAAHRHVLHFQTSAAANAVTAAANSLRTPAAAFDVAGVANASGEGGIVDVTGGTPAGTNSAPAFTGTAVAAAALVEASGDLSALTVRVRAIGF